MSGKYMSNAQKKKLADLMSGKKDLRSGKFTSTFTKPKAQKEWQEIAAILNAMPGATKTWQSWRKSWQDLLSKTKCKKGAILKAINKTGGGQEVPPLDEVEDSIASLIDRRTITGHAQSSESEAHFDFETDIHFEAQQGEEDEEITVVQILSDEVEAEDTGTQAGPTKPRQKKINIKTLMKEKLELKKKLYDAKTQFYTEFLKNMEKQNAALELIASAIEGAGKA